MRHSVRLVCVRYRLRPVAVDDARFIVELRRDPERSRFLHEISPRVEDQAAWIEKYFARPDDYYFIVEAVGSGEPHGTIGIHDMEAGGRRAQWGRWILKPGSMAALESAWLIYETGFSAFGLESLSSRTIVENLPVVSFHDSFGATRVAVVEENLLVRGERKHAIEHRVTAAEWPALRDRHFSMISRLARHAQQ